MARIESSSLHPELKKNLIHHAYTAKEMIQIQKQMKRIVDTRKKGFHRAAFVCLAVMILLAVLTFSRTGFSEAALFSILLTCVLFFPILGLVWYLQIGKMKGQYNRAVAKGYPESANEYFV